VRLVGQRGRLAHGAARPPRRKDPKQALKDAHPGVKFSVRSHNYAGGASVRVNWTDGPTCREVEATANRYAGADFDGMTDMKSYHDALLSTEDGAEVVHFGADFIPCQRTISDEYRARLEKEIEDFTSEPFNPSKAYHVAASSNTYDGPHGLSHDRHGTTWGSVLLHRLAYSRPVRVEAKR
jgi:Large polyvalent protein associated domain 29